MPEGSLDGSDKGSDEEHPTQSHKKARRVEVEVEEEPEVVGVSSDDSEETEGKSARGNSDEVSTEYSKLN